MRLWAAVSARYRRLPRVYWFLWTGMLVNRIGAFVLPFLTLFLTRTRAFDIETAGLALTAFGAGSVGATFFGGQIVDRWGRRPAILTSMVGGAAALIALSRATTLPEIVTTTAVFGFLADLYRPAVSAAVADVVEIADRPFAYGTLYWAYNLGFAIAPVVGGLLAENLGYDVLFVGDAATMLACAVLIFFLVPETRPSAAARPISFNPLASRVLRDKPFLVFLFASLFIGLLMVQASTVLPARTSADGISEGMFGKIIATNGALIVLLQLPLSHRLTTLPRRPVMAIGSLLVGLGFAAHSIAHSPLGHVGAVALWTVGEISVLPLASAAVADFAPIDQRGRYQGASQMTWSVASFIGPTIATRFFGEGGASLWGMFCIGAGVVAAVAYTLVRTPVPRDGE